MKRIEIHLTDEESIKLHSIAKTDGRKRKQFIENEIRKIMLQRGNYPTQPTDKLDTSNPPNGLSDLEKLKQTFDLIGIKYDIEILPAPESSYKIDLHDTTLTVNGGCGYRDFYVDFYFLDGKLTEHGCWEWVSKGCL